MNQKIIISQLVESIFELNQSQSKETVSQVLFGSKRKK